MLVVVILYSYRFSESQPRARRKTEHKPCSQKTVLLYEYLNKIQMEWIEEWGEEWVRNGSVCKQGEKKKKEKDMSEL